VVCRVWGWGCCGLGFRVWCVVCGVWGLESGKGLEVKVKGLDLRVYGSGFGVQSLGFGIQE